MLANNNSALPLVDDSQLAGGAMSVANEAARNAITLAKRKVGMIVSWTDTAIILTKKFIGATTADANWTDNAKWGSLDSFAASATVAGIAELATQAETDAGTDDLRIVTPLKLKTTTLVLCPDATETVKGKAELATQAEVDAGTDDLKIVTPLKLRATYKLCITVCLATSFSPVDGTSYYFGIATDVGSASTTDQQFFAGVAGVIKFVSISWFASGAAGSNEAISVHIRINGAATLIATISDTNAGKHFVNAALNISVAATDLIAFRLTCPTWVGANPTGVRLSGYLTIEG